MNLIFRSMFTALVFGGTLQAATLTLTTKYGATGGLAGDLNQVSDKVNGRSICASVNDYANGTPGCDMSSDAGYNDNGTGDPSDDYYTGDLLVRTNDSFEVIAKYSWLGNAGGDEEQVTISSTLPLGTGFIWDGIPGGCDSSLSTLSSDKKEISCVRKDFDMNDVGSFAEQFTLPVKVEGDTPNGAVPGDIVLTISEPTGISKSDGVRDGLDSNLLKVTASPRWNIDKHAGPGYYTTRYGVEDDVGNVGYELWYNFTIEVDEVDNEEDSLNNPSLGNEALKGGKNATVTFTDDLSQISPNAKLVTWSTNGNFTPTSNPCDMDSYTNSDEPYPYLYTTYPDRSIPVDAGTMDVTCTQSGSSVSVTVTGIDGTLTNAPKKTRTGALIPANRKIAAIGLIRVFVPLSDVENGNDGIPGNGDDGTLNTTNCIRDFQPKGISDGANFAGDEESEMDNCRNLTLVASGGSWDKNFRRGWSDQADQIAQWGGEGWSLPPTDASYVEAGDGYVSPGSKWGTYTVYHNTGGTDIDNPVLCDVIDTETYAMTLLNPDADNPGTLLDDRIHAVDLNYGPTESVEGLTVEYATGYVGDWPPNAYEAPKTGEDEVVRECSDSSITWYPDVVTAESTDGRPVSKIRVSAPTLKPSQYIGVRIKHTARSNFLTSNQPIPNDTILVNHASYKSSLTNDIFRAADYYPNDATQNPGNGSGSGDRLTMVRAKARILKDMSPTAVSLGSEVAVQLTPSFTTDGPVDEMDNVTIVDLLPKGLEYVNGSTVGGYDGGSTPFGEPTIISPVTESDCDTYVPDIKAEGYTCGVEGQSILVWDLGTQTTGADYSDLNFTAIVSVDAGVGTLSNYVQIASPSDSSVSSKRVANASVSNSVPSSLLIVKSVQTPLHEINKGELLNWMEFRLGLRNGSSDSALSNLDVIDIIPFNGDGTLGSFTFSPQDGTVVDRKRDVASNFVGKFQLDSLSFDDNGGVCDSTGLEYWFTDFNTSASALDISPKNTMNTNNDGTVTDNWCQGTSAGPDAGCGYSKDSVTAVRIRGVGMEKSSTCFLNLKFSTAGNLDENIYSNTASATANGLDAVLSNTVSAKVYASSLGDKVWYDRDADGIQDDDEDGVSGVTVNLHQDGQMIGTTTTSSEGEYTFNNLIHGTGYVVEVIKPSGYLVTSKGNGGELDSDINANGKTDAITLGEDETNLNIDAGLFTPVISGNIFDDGNNDGTVNGTPIATPDGTQLYVTLLDNSGTAMASKTVNGDGSYSFDGDDGVLANSNYSVVLSTTENSPTASLPTNWNNADGEHIGTDAGLDGSADGQIAVAVVESNVPNVNFGINKKPVATNVSDPSQFNPAGTVQVNVPSLVMSDQEDGTPTTVTIKTLPSNGILYYNGVAVSAGQVIPNFDNSKLTVDPNDGQLTVVFTYTTTDKAGVESDPATVTMPFTDVVISGHLYNDGDGNGNVNGTGVTSADGTALYVTLVNSGGSAVATKALNADGSYSFNGEEGVRPNTNYTVVLSTVSGGTTASLPTNWNHADGEMVGTTGTDGTPDGVVTVNVVNSNVTEVNFGINKKPSAVDKTEPTQPNPGGTVQVTVPTLSISDHEDGTPPTVTITSVPNNATLYYNGAAVSAGETITSFDGSQFTVDPDHGDQTVVFTYTTTDRANVVSDEATVTLPFTDIALSGTLFNDGNANGNVDGNATNSADTTQLYVTLVNASGTVLASKPLATDGTYGFSNADGVYPNTNYTIVLTDTNGGTTPKLPANWNNADGEMIGLAGTDGDANGAIAVSVLEDNIVEINFGINKKPVAQDKTEPEQFNPGSTTEVAVPALTITDKEDGVPNIITVTTLPTNATLYYDGTAVVQGDEIVDVDPSKFTVDPLDGDLTVVFNYTTTDRVGVVSDEATVTMPFKALQISGNIFNDGNNDNTVNGTGIAAPNGVQLYVTLLDDTDTVLASKEVEPDGSYAFGNTDGILPNSDYRVVLSTQEDGTTPSLPINWSNLDGEHIGIDAGTDGSNDGMIDVSVATSNVVEVNFGINKKPVAGDNSEPLQLNPGGSTQVVVPDLNISDNEDTTPKTVTIKTVPSHGILYYDGVEVVAGQVIENLDNSLLTLDPDHGDQVVSFTYTTTDAVGVESDVATISMTFQGLQISGNIFNDGNNDNTVNGTKIALADGVQLHATLLDNGGSVLATMPIEADGSYAFDGHDGIIPNSDYTVVLSQEANATASTLPATWNSADGEHIGTDAGLDGSADGKIAVSVVESDVVEVNLGINKQPIANDTEEVERLNPGQATQVSVPNLDISDNEDGTPPTVTIQTLPNNGTLYYDGIAVTAGEVIENFDNSKLTVDPIDGNQVVVFNYTTTDSVSVESEVATVTMPFRGLEISGYLFDDGNGDGDVNGTAIRQADEVQMYVNLLDNEGNFIASEPLAEDGSYRFDGNDSVTANTGYRLVVTTENNATVAKLPSRWNHADGENIGLVGTDGTADGIIVVNTLEANIKNINFGINKAPVATDKDMPSRLNLGQVVPVGSLNYSDQEDGRPTTVTIKSLPSNGTLYYNGSSVRVGQVITNFNNSLLTVQPVPTGTPTVVFTYTVTDSAGVVSNVARVTVPFTGLSISGNVFYDGNHDGDVNGQGTPEADETTLYVTLVDNNGKVLASRTLDSDGSYYFDSDDGINANSNYSVVLSDTERSTAANLPEDWRNADGENIGLTGTDGTPDGVIAVSVATSNVEQINFGINQRPVANNVERSMQPNPGANRQVDVIALEVSDNEDGIPTTVTIVTLPEAGTLYYDGVEVIAGQVISGFDNSLLTVDPLNGEQTIVFTYTTTDVTGWESEPARVRMPFAAVDAEENFNIQDDSVEASPDTPETTIPVLGNDEVGEGSTIQLINTEEGTILWNDGTAVGGTNVNTVDRIVVPGEGTWEVIDGNIVFTAEDGFDGVPTPIYYVVRDEHGNQSNVAQVSIISECYCEPFKVSAQDAVPVLNAISIFFMLFVSSLFSVFFLRKEAF